MYGCRIWKSDSSKRPKQISYRNTVAQLSVLPRMFFSRQVYYITRTTHKRACRLPINRIALFNDKKDADGTLMNQKIIPITAAAPPTRERKRQTPRGRGVEPEALMQVRELMGKGERRRDLLIEYLHLIN